MFALKSQMEEQENKGSWKEWGLESCKVKIAGEGLWKITVQELEQDVGEPEWVSKLAFIWSHKTKELPVTSQGPPSAILDGRWGVGGMLALKNVGKELKRHIHFLLKNQQNPLLLSKNKA